jgi:serralysin
VPPSKMEHLREKPYYISCVPPPRQQNGDSTGPWKSLIWNQNKLWPQNKKELKVFFLDKTDLQRNNKVISIAKEWEKFVDIKINETNKQAESDIRISYNTEEGSYSYVGTDCLRQKKEEETMNFGWFITIDNPKDIEYRATTIHEFGHALGFEHELQHPFVDIPWDEDKIYQILRDPPNEWSDEQIRFNILDKLDARPYINTVSEFDAMSIMCYTIDRRFLKSQYEELVPMNGRNSELSVLDKKRARKAYSVPLKNFPIGSSVRVMSKQDVLDEFAIVGRGDYFPKMDQYNGKAGKVVKLHPTNGVGISFENDEIFWYEPECLVKLDNSQSLPIDIERLYPGTRVRVISNANESDQDVGTISIHFEKDLDKITVSFANQVKGFFKPNEVKEEKFFYGNNILPFYSIEFGDFTVGSVVKVHTKKEVLKSFEYIGRDDYFDEMDEYSKKVGIVDLLHPTNGLRIKFQDGKSHWYEPGSLTLIKKNRGSSNMPRLPLRSLVLITNKDSAEFNSIGRVEFHMDQEYSKITVTLREKEKFFFSPKDVKLTDYYFK